jgi:beta-galactosidase
VRRLRSRAWPIRPTRRGRRDAAAAWLARPGGRWRGRALARPWIARLALAGVAASLAACLPAGDPGDLPPTLTIADARGGQVAMQNGIPVPTFAEQARPRIDLSGTWRWESADLDADEALTPRDASLPAIVAAAGGRERPDYDDTAWEPVAVPGPVNPPPDRTEPSGWLRRTFRLPRLWEDRVVTLKFGAANYLADVWLNGTWLGYHEGGATPFAFDATAAARPGEENVLAVRVVNPPWGTRNDIVPWGLADWWNFTGLLRPVSIEASAPVHAVRADVVPHLDGADVSLVLQNAGPDDTEARVTVELFPARVDDANLLDLAPRSLIAGATPLARQRLDPETLAAGEIVRLDAGFLVADPALWTPRTPSLHVVRVTVRVDGRIVDQLHETFGFRQVAVDPSRPAVLLNGSAVTLPGVALHDQILATTAAGQLTGGIPTPDEIRAQLLRARAVGARLVRTGHAPANPALLDLADRLGLAVWEEIPLYHYTPQTFDIAMRRGIPQQMLREMALRDMNRPSVLFHGLANESTGEEGRADALRQLHEIDRAIDGTRLTGQAAYGFNPSDPTSAALDVNGFTMYHGVFYGSDAKGDTAAALATARATFPDKPVMVLEFGRWADGAGGEAAQQQVFAATSEAILSRRATRRDGYVSGAVWWTLEDYATLRPNLEVEHFGLYAPGGDARPVAATARSAFVGLPDGLDEADAAPLADAPRAVPARSARPVLELLGYLAYGAAVAVGLLALVLAVLVRGGGRSAGRLAELRSLRRVERARARAASR